MSNLYIIDTNILITANNLQYPLDIMPKFWDLLLEKGGNKTVLIDRVKSELLAGGDLLSEWVADNCDSFINKTVNDTKVVNVYSSLIQDVQNNDQYFESAKQEFASVADSWICAHALAYNYVVVTLERYQPDAKKRILIPNICKQYGIKYISLIDYIREIGITLQ